MSDESHSAAPLEGDVHHGCPGAPSLAQPGRDEGRRQGTLPRRPHLPGGAVRGHHRGLCPAVLGSIAADRGDPAHPADMIHRPPLPPGPGLSLPVAVGAPPDLLHPRLNRHLGRRVEPLAGERRPPHPSQAPSRPGSRRSGPDTSNLEMLEFALSQSQEMAKTALLLPPEEGREENPMFLFCSAHFLKERAISFSSGFSGPWDNSVGRSTSPHTSSQSCMGPREFSKDASERAAFCTIQPYSPSLHHHRYVNCAVGAACMASGGVAHAAQPVSLAHAHNLTWLRNIVRQGYDGTSHGRACPSSAELPEFLQRQECGTTETVSEASGAYGIHSCSHATRVASYETT